jgi:inosine/xanthosine triphosphatase
MKKVIVASENPVKLNVAKNTFASVFPEEEFDFVAVKSESGVPDQPMNEETEQGAYNRLQFIKQLYPDADYWVSQEGGLFEEGERLYNRAWMMVTDSTGYVAKCSTAQFYLPTEVIKNVRADMESGPASDLFFNSINSKQKAGSVAHLTDGIIDRERYYLQASIIALSELKHQDWYK